MVLLLLLGIGLPLSARLGFRLELGQAIEVPAIKVPGAEIATTPEPAAEVATTPIPAAEVATTPAAEPTLNPQSVPTPPTAPIASLPPPAALPLGRGEAASLPLPSPTGLSIAGCSVAEEFVGLFQALGEEQVGRCLDNETSSITTGDLIQRTTRGLFVWDKKQGVAAFTDGSTTWYGCPTGPQRRSLDQPVPC